MEADRLTHKLRNLNFNPNVIAEQVSKILTQAILEGALKGGDRLIEAELQKQFGVSRSPLREALRDLEKKGLVVIVPRKGTFVKRITHKDIEEYFPVRSVLEGLAAQEAYAKMNTARLEEMERMLARMQEAAGKNDTKAYWEAHLRFHDIFILACENDVLIGILKTLRMHGLWYRFSYQYYQEDLPSSLSDHEKIYHLFNSKKTDPKKIGTMVQRHIQIAYKRFLSYLGEQE